MTVPTPPPVPEGWHRDEPPRDLRERFIDTLSKTWAEHEGHANAAWQLILDAWRVIEVASARGACSAPPSRYAWMAALRVAIFRADHPAATPAPAQGG